MMVVHPTLDQVLKTHREMELALSKSVLISQDQVVMLVVDDLIGKFEFNLERGNREWSDVFEKVLRYYLTEEELSAVKAAAKTRRGE